MSSRQPHPRRDHVAVGAGQKLFIWGGEGDLTQIHAASLESFDVLSGTWERPERIRGPLPARLQNLAFTNDGQTAYLFGGFDGSRCTNTLYRIDLSTHQCKELAPENSSCVPMKKFGSRMVYFNQQLVVYGGSPGRAVITDELHVFNLRTNVWTSQPTSGSKPPPLAWHTFNKIDHHRAVVFGGFTGSTEQNDAYVLDMETWHWTKLNISGAKPLVRNCHATCCLAGPFTGQHSPLLIVVGGWYTDSSTLGDVWLLDVDKGVWSEVTLPEPITPQRCHSATVFGSGPRFRTVVLYGGYKLKGFSEVHGAGGYLSEATLLMLELRRGSWQVTRVVKGNELQRGDESLREQMRKLELSPQEDAASRELQDGTGQASTDINETFVIDIQTKLRF